MASADKYTAIKKHLQSFFSGHQLEEQVWTVGPNWKLPDEFRVVEVAPGPQCGHWVYASVGACEAQPLTPLEFFIVAPYQDVRHVELITMTAWYHRTEHLGLGHTFPIGGPWLPESTCEFMLVSLPYPFGPDLEICHTPDGDIHLYWLFPITAAERTFKVREGVEALEKRFEDCELEYWAPGRPSVAG